VKKRASSVLRARRCLLQSQAVVDSRRVSFDLILARRIFCVCVVRLKSARRFYYSQLLHASEMCRVLRNDDEVLMGPR
jgi:hypothetical protein